MALKRRHGDSFREDGGSGASEMLVMSPHAGTHIDALCHASLDGKLHGGVDAYEAQAGASGFHVLGAETIRPFVCRGVLLDVAKTKGVAVLEPAYEVTAEDLAAAAAASGVTLEKAEVILVRTGWATRWADADTYAGHEKGAPGVGVGAARWLANHTPRAVGADTMAFERVPASTGHSNLPVHSLLLVREGIHIIENLDLEGLAASGFAEFLFILSPLRLVGATGSPVRPLALVRD